MYTLTFTNTSGGGPACTNVDDLPVVATWASVTGKPAFGTASLAATGDFATAAQGTLADSAVQPATLTAGLAPKLTASFPGGTTFLRADGTWQTPAGGSVSLTTTDLDFGAIPTRAKRFTVNDASVTPSSKISVGPNGSDEWEMDPFSFLAIPASGSYTVVAQSLNAGLRAASCIIGLRTVNVLIG